MKQVMSQRIREAEREMKYEEYAGREGDIVTGIIQQTDARYTLLDLGRVEALLPQAEQVPYERPEPGARVKAYIVEVRKTAKGPQIVVSRTHPGLIKRLFELEVPEIADGVVEIKACAREPGARTKIAVWSNDSNVDPVGACVGARGARVRMVVNELRGEKIDIVPFSDEPADFVMKALSPAKVKEVRIDEDTGTAEVIVPDYQLSLAIGKEGQNARLAARLTGWRVDIKSETQLAEEEAYNDQDWAEGEWVVDPETGEQVWQPAEGGEAMSVEAYAQASAEQEAEGEALAEAVADRGRRRGRRGGHRRGDHRRGGRGGRSRRPSPRRSSRSWSRRPSPRSSSRSWWRRPSSTRPSPRPWRKPRRRPLRWPTTPTMVPVRRRPAGAVRARPPVARGWRPLPGCGTGPEHNGCAGRRAPVSRRLRSQLPGNIRVYELARELGLTNKETLDLCIALGIGVKSHSSSVVEPQADRVRRKAEREGLVRDVQPEEPEKKPPAKAKKKKDDEAPAEAPAPAAEAPRPHRPRRPAPDAPRPPPPEPAAAEAPAPGRPAPAARGPRAGRCPRAGARRPRPLPAAEAPAAPAPPKRVIASSGSQGPTPRRRPAGSRPCSPVRQARRRIGSRPRLPRRRARRAPLPPDPAARGPVRRPRAVRPWRRRASRSRPLPGVRRSPRPASRSRRLPACAVRPAGGPSRSSGWSRCRSPERSRWRCRPSHGRRGRWPASRRWSRWRLVPVVVPVVPAAVAPVVVPAVPVAVVPVARVAPVARSAARVVAVATATSCSRWRPPATPRVRRRSPRAPSSSSGPRPRRSSAPS